MAENVEPNEETTETPAEDTPEVVAHAASNVAWCGVHQESAVDEPEVVAHAASNVAWCGVHQESAVDEPEVIAHSEEDEDTPWCVVHQEHQA
ncbi:hypothetical protein OG780_41195 [Streptomyces sp. NBC_00386]|jgi:cation transport regulator ChaB|uniref:hypothetical protein n=1 Tax=Streptomyces sp. NBC_00386 TaxID=2975734 RepID=UPI002E1ADC83